MTTTPNSPHGSTARDVEHQVPVPPELHRAGYRRVYVSTAHRWPDDRRGIIVDWMGRRGLDLIVRRTVALQHRGNIDVAVQAAHDELDPAIWRTSTAFDTGATYRTCDIGPLPPEGIAADAALAAEVESLIASEVAALVAQLGGEL